MLPKNVFNATQQEVHATDTLFPIQLKELCFEKNDKQIIRSISVDFTDVPCTAVLGHNGAGKSVLLRMLHGLIKQSSGTISWGMASSSNTNRTRHSQAMVFQRPVLLRRSVAANLRYVLKREGHKGTALETLVAKYLSLAELTAAANRPARVLSGGEAQRLAIVRALATNPLVLFLDEPTASLDPSAKASVENLLQQITDSGVRLILVTQDIGQAERLASHIIMLHEGRVVESGKAIEVLNGPKSIEGQAFLQHKI